MLRKIWIMLIAILVVGVIFRLRNWNLGFIDAHPMRQTDAECVAYFLATGEADMLHPKSCLMRPVSNKEGYFFLEFPVYEGIIALGYKMFGVNVAVVRVINIILYLTAGIGVFYFVKRLFDEKIALFSTLLFSLTPSSIFFLGHALHPDVFAVALMAVSLALFVNNKSIWISGILLGLSVATRPFGLIVLPVYWWVCKADRKKCLLITVLSVSFYGLWWWWTNRIGLKAEWENWVLFGQEKLLNWGYFRNFMYKNVIGEVLGKTISLLFGLGIINSIVNKEKRVIPIIAWLLLVPVYWLIAPNGNMTHQYYGDIYIIPAIIVGAVGLNWLWDKSKLAGILLLLLVMVNGYRTSDYLFKDVVRPEKLDYAQEITDNIPENSKVVYMVKSDSIPLSLSHRQGWMLGEWPTDVAPTIWAYMEMKHFGLEYLVEPKESMDMKREDVAIIEQNYPLVKETENLRIFRWNK